MIKKLKICEFCQHRTSSVSHVKDHHLEQSFDGGHRKESKVEKNDFPHES